MVYGALYRPTVLEINLTAIERNIEQIRSLLPKHVEIMAIVKANGYGHGAVPIAKRALASGATRLGVAVLDEALELRAAGITAPILILGNTPLEGIIVAQQQNITCTFYTEAQVEAAMGVLEAEYDADSAFQPLAIHLKVDTGMNRLGFTDVTSLLRASHKIVTAKSLYLEGIFTHFACADEEDSSYTHQQMERFNDMIHALEQNGIQIDVVHLDNSAGAIHYPEWGHTLVRYGIALYGLYPSAYSRQTAAIDLDPALCLKSAIIHLKEVPSGTPISYGCTYVTSTPARIATIPIGYGDGYPRALSNCGEVLVRGCRARIVGTICMDQFMIDVTHISEVAVGDEVVLIGKQGEQRICADELADKIGTIHYEVVTRLGERLHRKYLD